MDVAYPFVLDVQGCPTQIISLFVVTVCVLPFPLSCTENLCSACFGGAGRGQISPGYLRVRKLCCKGKPGLTHVVSVWWPLAVFYLVTTVFRESHFSGFIATLRCNGWQSWSRPFSLQPMGSGTRPRCPTICVLHTVFASRMPAEPCEIQQVLPRCHWRDALRGRILDLVAYSVTLTVQVRVRTI